MKKVRIGIISFSIILALTGCSKLVEENKREEVKEPSGDIEYAVEEVTYVELLDKNIGEIEDFFGGQLISAGGEDGACQYYIGEIGNVDVVCYADFPEDYDYENAEKTEIGQYCRLPKGSPIAAFGVVNGDVDVVKGLRVGMALSEYEEWLGYKAEISTLEEGQGTQSSYVSYEAEGKRYKIYCMFNDDFSKISRIKIIKETVNG